jgi:small-conductance mechanosensitive channel
MNERLVSAIVVVAIIFVVWLAGLVLRRRLPERWSSMVGQLVPVIMLAVAAIGALIITDPDQAQQLSDSLFDAVPTVLFAVIILIVANALGRIVGEIIELALGSVSPTMAGRARLMASSVILGIGVVIALQRIGVSTDIILVLVASIAFGAALAVALGVGLGSVPLAKQVAAGRHVQHRYRAGDRVRLGDVAGVVIEIGLSTTRVRVDDDRVIDVPNADFLAGAVSVES